MRFWQIAAIVVIILIIAIVLYVVWKEKRLDPEDDMPFLLPGCYKDKLDYPHELRTLYGFKDDRPFLHRWQRQGTIETYYAYGTEDIRQDFPKAKVNLSDLSETWTWSDMELERERLFCRMGDDGYLSGPSGYEVAAYNAYLKSQDSEDIYWLTHEWGHPTDGVKMERFLMSFDKVHASMYSTIYQDKRYNHLIYYRPNGTRIAVTDVEISQTDRYMTFRSPGLGIHGHLIFDDFVENQVCTFTIDLITGDHGRGIYFTVDNSDAGESRVEYK